MENNKKPKRPISKRGISKTEAVKFVEESDIFYSLKYLNDYYHVFDSIDGTTVPVDPLSDRDIVTAALKTNGFNLLCVSPSLKADKNIVMAALKENIKVYPYVKNFFGSDPDVKRLMDLEDDFVTYFVKPKEKERIANLRKLSRALKSRSHSPAVLKGTAVSVSVDKLCS